MITQKHNPQVNGKRYFLLVPLRMSFSISNCRSSARWRNACFSKYLKETKDFYWNTTTLKLQTQLINFILCSLVWMIQYTGQCQQMWTLILNNNCVRQFSDLDAAGDYFASYKSNIVAIEKSPKNYYSNAWIISSWWQKLQFQIESIFNVTGKLKN